MAGSAFLGTETAPFYMARLLAGRFFCSPILVEISTKYAQWTFLYQHA